MSGIFKASGKVISVILCSAKLYQTLAAKFSEGPVYPWARSSKSKKLFPVSPACHSDPTSETWGNGEGNCISTALPHLQCSGLLRWVRSRCQEYRSKEEKETSWQLGTEIPTSSIFPLGKVWWQLRIHGHLLPSVTFLPLLFKQPLRVLTTWISN